MTERKERNSDAEIIQGIKEHDRKILTEIYNQLFPIVEVLVKLEGGSKAEAWDVFQEALSVIYSKIVASPDGFTLNSSFSTFFYAVCKRIWQKHLRWRSIHNRFVREAESNALVSEELIMDEEVKEALMINLFHRNIKKLKPACRKLIEATIKGLKTQKIISMVKLGSAQAVYNKRRQCIEKLFKLIHNDPDYLIFKDHEKP
jgi:DNA-directed RNA polymerase specialized sigma24 family protein